MNSINPSIIHISVNGDDCHDGSINKPLRHINSAAQIAKPGDTVLVLFMRWYQCVALLTFMGLGLMGCSSTELTGAAVAQGDGGYYKETPQFHAYPDPT
ncbi:MAG: hypothetical protein HON81_02225, partial [Verrucomicrobia bacterium]|nr:hypothetical protein [Verrucomicrobiota bacterium]